MYADNIKKLMLQIMQTEYFVLFHDSVGHIASFIL